MNYDEILKKYKATALYKGNQVDPEKHPVIAQFMKGLNEWQRDKFLLAEKDDDALGLVIYIFMPNNEYTISIFYDDNPGFVSSVKERKPRAGETWCRHQNVREGDLTVENLNKVIKVMMTIEADPVQDTIWGTGAL